LTDSTHTNVTTSTSSSSRKSSIAPTRRWRNARKLMIHSLPPLSSTFRATSNYLSKILRFSTNSS
jgi:hypothetical protein